MSDADDALAAVRGTIHLLASKAGGEWLKTASGKNALHQAVSENIGAIRSTLHDSVRSALSSKDFQRGLELEIASSMKEVAMQVFAEMSPEIEQRIRKLVAEQYEKRVNDAARDYLSQRLAKIQKKLESELLDMVRVKQ
jgi:hypothetical protein